jgi:hypothetical protein
MLRNVTVVLKHPPVPSQKQCMEWLRTAWVEIVLETEVGMRIGVLIWFPYQQSIAFGISAMRASCKRRERPMKGEGMHMCSKCHHKVSVALRGT